MEILYNKKRASNQYRFGRNVIIFGIDMSSSVHIGNKKKDILILGKGPTQGLGKHSLTAEKMYAVNPTKSLSIVPKNRLMF